MAGNRKKGQDVWCYQLLPACQTERTWPTTLLSKTANHNNYKMNSKMMIKTTNDKVSIHEHRFKYHLNNESIITKLKEHAITIPMVLLDTLNNTRSIQFSTGAYVSVISDLVQAWEDLVGQAIDEVHTDGLDVSVTSVTVGRELGDLITQHTTRLLVEGEVVTITTYNTTVKMVVQGGHMMEEYCNRALLPYITSMLEEAAVTITNHNNFFINMPIITTKPKRRGGAAESVGCTSCDKKFQTKQQQKIHMGAVHGNLSMITRMKPARTNQPVQYHPEEEVLPTTSNQLSLTMADPVTSHSPARGLDVLPTTPTNPGTPQRRTVISAGSSSPLPPLGSNPTPLPLQLEGGTPSPRASPPPTLPYPASGPATRPPT